MKAQAVRPTAFFRAFTTACDEGDFTAASAMCTDEGLQDAKVGIGRLLVQAESASMAIMPFAELLEGDRAACCVTLGFRRPRRTLEQLWLTARFEGLWQLVGLTKSEREAALYVAGVIPPLWREEILRVAPKAQTWGEALLAQWDARDQVASSLDELLSRLSEGHALQLVCLGAFGLPEVGRYTVGIGAMAPDGFICQRTWLSLEQSKQTGALDYLGNAVGAKAALLIEPLTQ